MNFNRATIIGRLTTDIELRKTATGQSVSNFSVATNFRWKDKEGNRKEEATFHKVVAWGRGAEYASQYGKKGDIVFIDGRIQNRKFMNNEGAEIVINEIVAENLQVFNDRESRKQEFMTQHQGDNMSFSGGVDDASVNKMIDDIQF